MPMGIHVPPWPAYALPHGYPLGYGSIEHPMHTKICG